jgi:hypothetical protein
MVCQSSRLTRGHVLPVIATLFLERLHQRAELRNDGALHVISAVRFAIDVKGQVARGVVNAEHSLGSNGLWDGVRVIAPSDYTGPWNTTGCVRSVAAYVSKLTPPRAMWFSGARGALVPGYVRAQLGEYWFPITADAIPPVAMSALVHRRGKP